MLTVLQGLWVGRWAGPPLLGHHFTKAGDVLGGQQPCSPRRAYHVGFPAPPTLALPLPMASGESAPSDGPAAAASHPALKFPRAKTHGCLFRGVAGGWRLCPGRAVRPRPAAQALVGKTRSLHQGWSSRPRWKRGAGVAPRASRHFCQDAVRPAHARSLAREGTWPRPALPDRDVEPL